MNKQWHPNADEEMRVNAYCYSSSHAMSVRLLTLILSRETVLFSLLDKLDATLTDINDICQDTDGRHPRMKRKYPDENSTHVSQPIMDDEEYLPRMKRKYPDENATLVPQPIMDNQESQFRNNGYDRNSLPSG